MIAAEFSVKKVLMGSIEKGEDLLFALKKIAIENNIYAGRIEVLGFVSEANVGYLNNKTNQLDFVKYRRPMNIVSCNGTITEKEDSPYVHLHMALSDSDGNMYGGHLADATIVYSAEFTIAVYEGDRAIRTYDETTGLYILK